MKQVQVPMKVVANGLVILGLLGIITTSGYAVCLGVTAEIRNAVDVEQRKAEARRQALAEMNRLMAYYGSIPIDYWHRDDRGAYVCALHELETMYSIPWGGAPTLRHDR